MLRLLPDRYFVSIGDRSARLFLKAKNDGSPTMLAERNVAEGEQQDNDAGLMALEALLGEAKGIRRVSLVLHEHLTAYATLPWPGEVLKREELEQLAGIRLEEVYGTRVNGWEISAWQDYQRQGVACGIPPNFAHKAREICRRNGVVIDAARPSLAEVVERARIPRSVGHWLVADLSIEGCLLALHSEIGWSSVRFVRRSDLAGGSSRALIQREGRLLGVTDELLVVLHEDGVIRQTTFGALENEVFGV